jgi:exodeoxyribonuclease VII large subunit
MSKENEPMTITQFCNFVKNIMPNKKFLVTGEVNQLKNSHGHLFFTFKDNENCLSTTIWKSKAEMLKINLKEGDKITVEGKLDFYSASGKLNFIVDKIVTNEGIGDLQKKYDLIKSEFQKKGYFDKDNKKVLHTPIKKILVLTSESGAAYHDFMYCLENGGSKVDIDLIDVIVQGSECPKNICLEMEELKKNNTIYDLVILTRGGGSFQDLFGFSQPELIETIHNFQLPTLSAIGHQVDNPLSDLVCDYCAPTPSLAAQFIVDYNKSHLRELQKIQNLISNELNTMIFQHMEMLSKLNQKINSKFQNFFNKKKQDLINDVYSYLRKLDTLENKLEIFDNKDMILHGNGTIFHSSNDLLKYKEKTMEIIWNNVIVKVKIESIKTL